MSIAAILGGWATWARLSGSSDDDWVDRLSHIYTVLILCIFALFTGGNQYAGDPIHCWTPAQFTPHWVAYTKSRCWIKNTYYIPTEDAIPVNIEERGEQEIIYYQWIPIILVFMALLFKLPSLVWKVLGGYSGINLDKIVNMTTATQIGDPEKRNQTVKHIALYMDRWLDTHREYHWNFVVRMRQRVSKIFCLLCNRRQGTFLTGLYLFSKCLYVLNVIGQFFILNGFMGEFFTPYGFEVMSHMWEKSELRESRRFPKVTLCDFEIRQLQNIQRYTVQCVLPINLFNEKIFIFLWFWYVFVATVTCASLLFWFWRILFRQNRARYVRKYLRIVDEIHGEGDKKNCRIFADHHLRDDGIFVLRLVAKNSNAVLVTDLIQNLWNIYKEKSFGKSNGVRNDASNV